MSASVTRQRKSVALEYDLPSTIGSLIDAYMDHVIEEQPIGTLLQRTVQKMANWDMGGVRGRAARCALQGILASIKQHKQDECKVTEIFSKVLREVSTRQEERCGTCVTIALNTPFARQARRILEGAPLLGVSQKDRLIAVAASGPSPGVWPTMMWH